MVNDTTTQTTGVLRGALMAVTREDDGRRREEPTTFWLSKKGVTFPAFDSEDEARSTYYIYTGKGLTILGPALD